MYSAIRLKFRDLFLNNKVNNLLPIATVHSRKLRNIKNFQERYFAQRYHIHIMLQAFDCVLRKVFALLVFEEEAVTFLFSVLFGSGVLVWTSIY